MLLTTSTNIVKRFWSMRVAKEPRLPKRVAPSSPPVVTAPRQTVNYKRSDGRNIVQNGVFGYFPKFSGHGKDGKFGKYTIKMAKNKLNR